MAPNKDAGSGPGDGSRGAELEFYGAAGRVTGSCHILRVGRSRIRGQTAFATASFARDHSHTVLLDCGLIQGDAGDEAGNADEFPFEAASVDAVVLSHAHLDHSGRLPLLVRRGFRGVIHTQNATRALMQILLNDAADLELGVVRRENRWRSEQGLPMIEPLFNRDDVASVLALTQGHHYDEVFEVVPGVRVRLHEAGHIMGSAVVQAEVEVGTGAVTIAFSGDLGQYDSPILRDAETPNPADLVIMETTYGDRCHRDIESSLTELAEVLERAHRLGGNVLIPAFAVGRSQELLYYLGRHYDEWRVGRWQIFLDSPLAIEASRIYWDFEHLFDAEATEIFRERNFMPQLANLHFTRTGDESRVINRLRRGAIVIAGSGMCNGGRILHHFRRDIGRKETQIVFTGFQPPGTLGRRIIDGAETVRIHGESYPVRATIHTIGGLSAHGDRDDLLRWYGGFDATPGGKPVPVFLVHGDAQASESFSRSLRERVGVQAHVARSGERVDLSRFVRQPGDRVGQKL